MRKKPDPLPDTTDATIREWLTEDEDGPIVGGADEIRAIIDADYSTVADDDDELILVSRDKFNGLRAGSAGMLDSIIAMAKLTYRMYQRDIEFEKRTARAWARSYWNLWGMTFCAGALAMNLYLRAIGQ